MALVFVFVLHQSVVTLLTGIPFERGLTYHKLFALVALFTGFSHGVVYWLEGDDGSDDGPPLFTVGKVDISTRALTGIVLEIVFGLLWLFSLSWIRRHGFECFYRLHWLLLLGAMGLALAHGAGGMLFGAGWWMLDVVYRYLFQARYYYTKKATLQRLPAQVMRLSFRDPRLRYKSGQYLFICIPQLSLMQWHPFSISSAPHEETVTIHLRVLGNWTGALYQMATDHPAQVDILMEGPCGEPSIDLDGETYQHFLMVSGGIGITPLQSMMNDLWHQYQHGRPIQKCWFVWAVRDRYMVDAVYDQSTVSHRLPHSFSPDGLTELCPDQEAVFYTEFYLTKVRNEAEFDQAQIAPETQQYLRFNRPDLNQILITLKDLARRTHAKTRVAVMVCGPKGMIKCVERLCIKHSDSDVRFDVHHETFDF